MPNVRLTKEQETESRLGRRRCTIVVLQQLHDACSDKTGGNAGLCGGVVGIQPYNLHGEAHTHLHCPVHGAVPFESTEAIK